MLSIVEEDRNLLQSKLSDEITARHELEGRFNKRTTLVKKNTISDVKMDDKTPLYVA